MPAEMPLPPRGYRQGPIRDAPGSGRRIFLLPPLRRKVGRMSARSSVKPNRSTRHSHPGQLTTWTAAPVGPRTVASRARTRAIAPACEAERIRYAVKQADTHHKEEDDEN